LSLFLNKFEKPNLQFIDHCVSSEFENKMNDSLRWYEDNLAFHRFWSIDDVNIETEFSALNFVVVSNKNESIKLNILEPAKGKRKSQVQEYLEYNGGPGVQHVAFHTSNIIETIKVLRSRGVEFLNVPQTYYTKLREKLKNSKVIVNEDLATLEQLKILLDFDDNGYLLQIFTKPLQDRPTLFFEIIQRNNFSGFGAGNFKSLFEAVEMEQKARGNLS
ncbi:4-hydroxyphenylpyruvate dioxygenase-like isoform X2, partial [Dinothrombium tinctorium]